MLTSKGAHGVLNNIICRSQKMLAAHHASYRFFDVAQEIAQKSTPRDDQSYEPVLSAWPVAGIKWS